ncbi:Cut9-interacting protein scn1 [Saitoella coloradoensis]
MDDWDLVEQTTKESRAAAKGKGERMSLKCVPSFGIHPWYCHLYSMEEEQRGEDKEMHYEAVLSSKDSPDFEPTVKGLPSPIPATTWLLTLRERISAQLACNHSVLLGEVGLDASAKLLPAGVEHWSGTARTSLKTNMAHQVEMLSKQLDLAEELGVGVSLHCVNAWGPLQALLQEKIKKWKAGRGKGGEKKPVRVCVHSFLGSVESLKVLLRLPANVIEIYISFSETLSARSPRIDQLIKATPKNRLLVETDMDSVMGMDAWLDKILERVGRVWEMEMEEAVLRTEVNWKSFVRFQNA